MVSLPRTRSKRARCWHGNIKGSPDPTRIDTAWLQGRGAEQAQGSSRLDIYDGNNRLSWRPNGRTSLNDALIHERQFTRGQFRRICELLDLRLVPQDI